MLALAGAVAMAAPAAAQADDYAPGVTLRVYDIGFGLDSFCTLKAGQTPNVDKLMPAIDFESDADFRMADNFVSHTLARLSVPTEGEYTFRLISDDGSRLSIDDQVVVDHDGLHGAEPMVSARAWDDDRLVLTTSGDVSPGGTVPPRRPANCSPSTT